MRYIKPQILSSISASTNIKGVDPTVAKGETPAFDSQNISQCTQAPAYGSDE